MKKLLLLLSFLLIVNSGFIACTDNTGSSESTQQFSAATQAAFQEAVDNAFSSATIKRGISVAVYKDGYAVWTYSAGYADGGADPSIAATSGTDMTVSTPGYAYSITKTFISALILSQVEAGLYSLDDTVADLLYDQADYDDFDTINLINPDATVAQLLSHTSGMPDYAGNLTDLMAMCASAYPWEPASILTDIVYQNYGATGSFQYSNTNYVLLGMIAEHKGGKPLNTLLNEKFFTSLGIDAVLGGQDTVPSDISHPYDDAYLLNPATFTTPGTYYMDFYSLLQTSSLDFYLGVGRGTWAAGGIIATAQDLAIWGYELYDTDGNAVSTTVRTQIKNSAASNGSYGYGVSYNSFTYNEDGTVGGKYGHGGSAPGYKTLLRYETNQRISVAIMTNANNTSGTMANPTYTDSQLGIVDREALADDIFNAYKDNN